MENGTPHFKLPAVKALVAAGKVRTTYSAVADHKAWPDVYRPRTQAGDVYLKPTVIDDVLIVSFKER